MKVYVACAKWFDKGNGNTYFNARYACEDGRTGVTGFKYGYGDHYKDEIAKIVGEDAEIIVLAEFHTTQKECKAL